MWNAAMWGAVSGSAVLLGALVAMIFNIPKRAIGLVMSFGTGVLMGAAAYELLQESAQKGGLRPTAYGFLIGASLFTLFELVISKRGGAHRKRSRLRANENNSEDKGSGLAIFVGTVMDAVPESVMIGASLIGAASVSWLLVIAIFLSNIPEGLSSTAGLRGTGFSRKRISVMWSAVIVVSTLSSMLGYTLPDFVPADVMFGIGAFAGGGIVAMVSSTMMPEAYEEGGPLVGLVASLGLLASLVLDSL